MLDLKSPEWADIEASCGGDGKFAAQLLEQLTNGDESAMDELHHQVCHQNSVGETAFVVMPHLVAIACRANLPLRVNVLITVGSIVASMKCYSRYAPKLRDEWREEFWSACADARRLTAESLQADLDPHDSLRLIGVLAALQNHANLALLIEGKSGLDLYCGECGKPIHYGDAENKAELPPKGLGLS